MENNYSSGKMWDLYDQVISERDELKEENERLLFIIDDLRTHINILQGRLIDSDSSPYESIGSRDGE